MGGRLLIAAFLSAVAVSTAQAAANPQLAYLQKTLKANMVAAFKKEAPALKITTVTCKLPANGQTAHCIAHFEASGVDGYYPVTAKLETNGKLKWTASSPKCTNRETGKTTAC